jgi:hypothetical protein
VVASSRISDPVSAMAPRARGAELEVVDARALERRLQRDARAERRAQPAGERRVAVPARRPLLSQPGAQRARIGEGAPPHRLEALREPTDRIAGGLRADRPGGVGRVVGERALVGNAGQRRLHPLEDHAARVAHGAALSSGRGRVFIHWRKAPPRQAGSVWF